MQGASCCQKLPLQGEMAESHLIVKNKDAKGPTSGVLTLLFNLLSLFLAKFSFFMFGFYLFIAYSKFEHVHVSLLFS